MHQIKDKTRLQEIFFVLCTGIGKIVVMDIMNQKLPFIISAIVFWMSYSIFRIRKQQWLVTYWGLSFTNSKPLFKIMTALGSIVIACILTYGIFIRPIHWSVNILFVLIVYPLWGLVQQFLMMSLFAGNMKDLTKSKLNHWQVVMLTSVLFSIVHYPSVYLIAATFLMGLIYTILFLKYRNILPLALFHGIIGGLFYYVILNRDAWVEFVQRYTN